jgi:hypothetical protein
MVAVRKIPMAEPGIEPGTSLLVVRSSDHQATRLVGYVRIRVSEGRQAGRHITELGGFTATLCV